MKHWITVLGMLLLSVACNTPKKAITVDTPSEEVEQRLLDTMVVSAPRIDEPEEAEETQEVSYELPRYNPSYHRVNDLVHTKLDLRFDWVKEEVIGQAFLTLEPLFYPTDTVVLDAKDFEISKIALEGTGKELEYSYDKNQIVVQLDKMFNKGEAYTLAITYVAHPAETGGSAAIQSDQGLFFINPRNEEVGKPQQIWTQGETEWNSRWFPTIDKPNERCTQEVLLTVQDRFKTLSNGVLISSESKEKGMRTDHWKMDKPHAPYLFMLAVGEFAVVEEEWEDIPLSYYVEPAYEASAKDIFGHTPEMLSFFSEKLGLKYPWAKYAQIVVRDYVSGAMENTSAVIFGEFVQKHSRELIDNHNDKIVAHEMFHHWFGDYVTCESWANLTMNEGFANYSEYLWMEHKYGRDAADFHMLEEWGGYFGSAQNSVHPLIHFDHLDKEDMFDAHSYNKGGSVLHMLRKYVGDDAFFASLNKYLTDNAYQAVEVHNLRLAFEAVTGEDLNWFFNQWYLEQGHPEISLSYDYDAEAKEAILTVEQTQNPETSPAIFQLPTSVDVYMASGEKKNYPIWVKERKQSFRFPAAEKPSLINFDPEKAILAIQESNKSKEELMFQFEHAPSFIDRLESIQKLEPEKEDAAVQALMNKALKDPFWVVQMIALQQVSPDADNTAAFRMIAEDGGHSELRAGALYKLLEAEDEELGAIAARVMEKEKAYPPIAAALTALSETNQEKAIEYAMKMKDDKSGDIIEAVSGVFAATGNAEYLPYFEENKGKIDGYQAMSFYDSYQILATGIGAEQALKTAKVIQTTALDLNESLYRRFGATRSLDSMRTTLTDDGDLETAKAITVIIEEIKKNETNGQLKQYYAQF
ncbi:MAG: alanyl aminopeptidase [Saprospiraceae bacterium]|nr:alanyl aminopeptidase [Saprospiraceae bacterium]